MFKSFSRKRKGEKSTHNQATTVTEIDLLGIIHTIEKGTAHPQTKHGLRRGQLFWRREHNHQEQDRTEKPNALNPPREKSPIGK
ncbi:MAG: hypothetical protein QNJ64_14045 [Crocosphaera sp.]|nr:hypothetical protein [Crocosphaera sp.]